MRANRYSRLTEDSMTLRLLPLLLLLACSSPPAIKGQVVDVWGEPVVGATVKMSGQPERPITDANGWFSLPVVVGTHVLKAGRKGYIQSDMEVVVGAEGAPPSPVFTLYPEPEEKGFHLVGSEGYITVPKQPVQAVGNLIKSYYGVKHIGDASIDGRAIRVVYHTSLRMDQVHGLEPEIHKLEFQREARLEGAITEEVNLNLWTSDKPIDISITALPSGSDYLIEATEELDPGAYALVTHKLFTPDSEEDYRSIAKPLRIAFPFELR
jgi:hypothetical protein